MTVFELLQQEKGQFFRITKVRGDWYKYTLSRDKIGLDIHNYILYLAHLNRLVIFNVAESTNNKPLKRADTYKQLVAQQVLDEFMRFAEGVHWADKPRIQRLPGLQLTGLTLDTLMVLPPEAFRTKLFSNEELINRTVQIFPIRHFEFSGTETQDEIDEMTSHNLYPLDWQRETFPKVKYYYRFNHKERVKGKELIIGTYSYLLNVIERMKSGFLVIMNYKDQQVRIESMETDTFRVEQRVLDRAALQAYVQDFLYQPA